MAVLNILFDANGEFSWINIIILLAVLFAGYFWGRGRLPRQIVDSRNEARNWQEKAKDAETELKRYAGGHEAEFRKQQQAVSEMQERVKSLEGDIRALASEKQQLLKQIATRDESLSEYSRQSAANDDRIKSLLAGHEQEIEDIRKELTRANSSLEQARSWEPKALKAQAEAAEAQKSFTDLQRKTLEFDLRLKSASEYAARVKPLEDSLAAVSRELEELKEKTGSRDEEIHDLTAQLTQARSALEAARAGEMALQQAITEGKQELEQYKRSLDQEKLKSAAIPELEGQLLQMRQMQRMLEQQLAEKSSQLDQWQKSSVANSSGDGVSGGVSPAADSSLITDNRQGEGEES